MRSLGAHCIFCACALRSVRTHHSRSSHHVLTRFSQSITLHSPLVWHLLIVQSDDIKFRLITIHTCSLIICYFFLSTDKTQCKNNSRGSRNKLFILCSHISFTVHFALSARSPFTIHKRSPNSVEFALPIHSACSHCSSGKVERFRDCSSKTNMADECYDQKLDTCKWFK